MCMIQSTLLCTHPTEHFLLNHLNQSFSIHRVNINFRLQSTILIAPRKRLTNHTIRSELGQTFIHCIKYTFVKNMGTLLQHRSCALSCVWLPSHESFVAWSVAIHVLLLPIHLEFKFSLLLNIKIDVNRNDWELQWVLNRFKMCVRSFYRILELI